MLARCKQRMKETPEKKIKVCCCEYEVNTDKQK